MQPSLLLFIAAIGALIAGGIASSKHRSIGAWALLGACFPLIAIVAVACLPTHVQLEELPS